MKILSTLLSLAYSCPEKCRCTESTVDCSSLEMTSLPAVPEETNILLLNNNFLTEFSTKNINVDNLYELNLSNNSLTVFLDHQRSKWSSLEKLNLSNNNLRWIPITMFQRMKALSVLNLSGNELLNVDQVKFPPYLQMLDLSNNQLTSVTGRRFLSSATSLEELDMSNNEIDIIEPRSLSNLRSLSEVNLSGNKLTELGHQAMYGLVSCSHIDLRNNQISDVSSTAFINFGHKSFNNKTIDLTENNIKFVMADWVQELENEAKFCQAQNECGENIQIMLKGNPVYCDCNMQQVRDEHLSVFGDLESAMCVNEENSIFDFHDEICCDISNIE